MNGSYPGGLAVSFMASAEFRVVVVPVATAIVGAALRYFSLPDDRAGQFFTRENFAFGIELSLGAILLFLLDFVDALQEMLLLSASDPRAGLPHLIARAAVAVAMLAATGFGLFTLSQLVRFRGWETTDKDGQQVRRLTLGWGVVVPLGYGLAVLGLAVRLVGG